MRPDGSVNIRQMERRDLERVLCWRNHPNVRRYMFSQHEIGLDEHIHWFERCMQDSTRHLLIYEITGQAMGFVQIQEIASSGIADWGFYLAPDAPKGVSKSFGLLALAYAFKTVGLHKICSQVLAPNVRSINFHKKLGFEQEGLLRQNYFDGKTYHDVVCFGLIAPERQPLT